MRVFARLFAEADAEEREVPRERASEPRLAWTVDRDPPSKDAPGEPDRPDPPSG